VRATSIYDFSAQRLSGEIQALSDFRGQWVLVVNTASECGFTYQYAGLEKLYRNWCARGFVVLGFPCNQFGGQEPGDLGQIAQTCYQNYGVSFPMFAKVEVNGLHAHPLFDWLKQQQPGFWGRRIMWNFTKFLVDRDGHARARFAPFTKPEKIHAYLAANLTT